jgi:hypothetical protein
MIHGALILHPIRMTSLVQAANYSRRIQNSGVRSQNSGSGTSARRVAEAIIADQTHVIDLDLRSYFDTVRHHIVLENVVRRMSDASVLWLLVHNIFGM